MSLPSEHDTDVRLSRRIVSSSVADMSPWAPRSLDLEIHMSDTLSSGASAPIGRRITLPHMLLRYTVECPPPDAAGPADAERPTFSSMSSDVGLTTSTAASVRCPGALRIA